MAEKYFYHLTSNIRNNDMRITFEKNEKANDKKLSEYLPSCDCNIIDIQRPTETEGPKILNPGKLTRILKPPSDNKHQKFAYKVCPSWNYFLFILINDSL